MKSFSRRLMVTVSAVILLTAGCSLNDLLQMQSPSLVGTWRPQNNALNTVRMTFLRDGSYEFDIDGDGAIDVGGRYDILFNRQVKLQDDEGTITQDCIEPAVYKFRMTSRGLRFYLLGDQCAARVNLLKDTWDRIAP